MNPTSKDIMQLRNSMSKIHPLSNQCWSVIEPLIYSKQLGNKDYFTREGHFMKELGYVSEGILRIYYQDEKGEEWNNFFLQKNDIVAPIMAHGKKSVKNIQALTKTNMLCVPYTSFEALAPNYIEINLFIKKLAFCYLELKQDREKRLLTGETMENYLTFKKTYPALENTIQHYHIASYLGITPTQLSRIRKKLKTHQHM